MQITLYPNNELRARVPPAISLFPKKKDRSILLVNRAKLAISDLPPVEACQYPSCPWPRPGYGGTPKPTPFSLYARRMLARAGGVFSPADEGRLVFLTGTLPGSTDAAMETLSRYSAWVVHELLTRLPRAIALKASDLNWEWVWEFQERGALHWHGVVECPNPDSAKALIAEFSRLWSSVLVGLSKKSGVDVFERSYGGTWAEKPDMWRIDAQLAYSSPQQYLSKYLGKDKTKGGLVAGFYPSRWYGCSRRILKGLKARTVIRKTGMVSDLPSWMLTDSDVEFLRWVDSLSSRCVPFLDKVGSGQTVVFYLKGESEEEVKRVVGSMASISEWFAKRKEEKMARTEKKERERVWKYVDQCSRYPYAFARLCNDIGERQRLILEQYLLGRAVDSVDMALIENSAHIILLFEGLVPSVNSEAPPSRGVDRKECEDAGRSEVCQVEIDYPGLPF